VDDETWLAIARSVDSGHVPTNEQYVRADLRASGYQIKAYARNTTLSHPHRITTRMFILFLSDRSVAGNPDACVVTYICECDPCGYLPKWAVNFDVDQPLVLAKYVQPTSFCALLARQSFSEPAHEPTVHFSINQDQAASGEGRQVIQQVRHARACPHPSTLAVHTFWSHFCSLTVLQRFIQKRKKEPMGPTLMPRRDSPGRSRRVSVSSRSVKGVAVAVVVVVGPQWTENKRPRSVRKRAWSPPAAISTARSPKTLASCSLCTALL